jgi:glycosyltransferase involved in cell wall biosynthesis
MARIFLPISLDQWRSPIASLLRAVVSCNAEHCFESFSNPTSDEDHVAGEAFWNLPQITKIKPWQAAMRQYDLVQTAALNPRNLRIVQYAKWFGVGKTKFLTTLNLEADTAMDARDWACYQKALKLTDYFLAVSEAVAIRPRLDAPSRFLGVIPNGFDSDYFQPSDSIPWLASLGSEKFPFVLWVSALEPRKHPEFLIELAERMPDVRFVAAGWEHSFYAQRYLPTIKGIKNIHWMGHAEQGELRSLLKHAKVMIFPSEREGLPLSVIEAHGMGLPVIAQPKSSLPEIIIEGKTGRLIPLNNISLWEQSIRLYLTSIPDRAAIRETVSARYDWTKVGEQYRLIYKMIFENRMPKSKKDRS